MPYPFIDNQLEKYLLKRRQLSIEQTFEYHNKSNVNISDSERVLALQRYNKISSDIQELKNSVDIAPRNHDIFISPPELAVAQYDSENVKPKNPYNCNHSGCEIRLRTFKNGSTHVVKQCLKCGRPIEDLKKVKVCDWQSLPAFDESITDSKNEAYNKWHQKRFEVHQAALDTGDEIPDFDYDNFLIQYKLNDPEPLSSHLCNHKNTQNTLRLYEKGGDAVVIQCMDCGKHIRSAPKHSVDNYLSLPYFDEKLQVTVKERHSAWCHRKMVSSKKERGKFVAQRTKDIKSGVYHIEINDTFNTYYDSIEWKKTRARILDRDDSLCQSCGESAECAHHIVYDRLGQENDIDLISLCNRCHNEVHKRQRQYNNFLTLIPTEISQLWEYGAEEISVYFDYKLHPF